MPAPFLTPAIVDNEEGWGPTTVPELLEGVPYAPYAKGEKVGRISDFTQSGFNKYGGAQPAVLARATARWLCVCVSLSTHQPAR